MNHIPRKNLFCVSFLSIYLLTAPVGGETPASQPASQPAKVKITVSRETTYVLGPLNDDGTVDYVAAINQMCSKGVTPDNNAAISLIKAIGPDFIVKSVRDRTFKILMMPPLPEKGEYFQDLKDFEQARAKKAMTEPDADAIRERLGKAMEAPWSAKDFPLIAEWLKANEKPLVLVAIAAERPRYYIPSLSSPKQPCMVNVLIPDFRRYKEITRALFARSMLKTGSGDIAAARKDLLIIHRLARLIGQGPTMVDRWVAINIEAFAYGGGTTLAISGKLTAAQAKAHLADIQSLPALPSIAKAIDNTDRFSGLDCVMMLSREGMPGLKAFVNTFANTFTEEIDEEAQSLPDQHLPLDWDLILVKMNQWYDRQSEPMRKPSFSERKQALAEFERDLEKLKIRIAEKIGSPEKGKRWESEINSLSGKPAAVRREASETMADFLVSILMPSLGRISEMYDRAIMQRGVAEVALALAACKAERGEYPEKLAELAPKYLKTIPDDLFIEKPLHYNRTDKGYLLYSIGPNMKDDGGKGRGDGKDCDDVVVKTK